MGPGDGQGSDGALHRDQVGGDQSGLKTGVRGGRCAVMAGVRRWEPSDSPLRLLLGP
jgi:hypothetical protein